MFGGETGMFNRRKLMLFAFTLVMTVLLSGVVLAIPKLKAPPVAPPVQEQPKIKKGTISGRVMLKEGGPLAGGRVLFFDSATGPAPEPDRFDRAPDIVRPIDEDGRFSVEIPVGKYYLGALKRVSGENIGPPSDGDYIFRSVDKKGRMKLYVIKQGGRVDVGTLKGAAPLKLGDIPDRTLDTTIEGAVYDAEGRPVAGAVVVAFLNPALQSKPLYVSGKTGADGIYVLHVVEGTYYLKARNTFSSGPPEPGQIVGFYGEGTPEAIAVKAGEAKKGVDFKVVLFPGRGPSQGSPGPR